MPQESHWRWSDETMKPYEPEPWDVVRDDGVTVVRSVAIAVADDQCLYLNRHNRRHSYEVRSAEGAA